MNDNIERTLSVLTNICANNAEAILASQIASLAIQLSDNKSNKNSIVSQMDLAAELIMVAKKKITREMIQS